MSRRTLLMYAGLSAIGAQPAAAQGAPIQIVVPYGAGGLTDSLGRLFAANLKDLWNAPVIVDNRPGAGGSIGAAYVAKSKPNGQTLLLGSVGVATNPHIFKALPYKPDDLTACAEIAGAPNVLYVHPSVPATNVKELVAYAKKNPGVLSFASAGIGSSPHLAAALFGSSAGIEIVHIAYKGTSAAMTDFLGGQVNAYFDTMQSMKYAKEGRIRALAIATTRRLNQAPDLPTVEESGISGVFSSSWFGFFLPAKTPLDEQERIARAVLAVAKKDDVKRQMVAMGVIPELAGRTAFTTLVDHESAKWGALIRKLNIVGE